MRNGPSEKVTFQDLLILYDFLKKKKTQISEKLGKETRHSQVDRLRPRTHEKIINN